MKLLFFTILIILSVCTFAQTNLIGKVIDDKGMFLPFATVSLLKPNDSTLVFYVTTDSIGFFEIKNVKVGKYILKSLYIGYQTLYKTIDITGNNNDKNEILIMNLSPINLNETVISSEHIPIVIKRDTVEYNTAAYKTKPDGAVEDLLKQLPGVDVDREGNIKVLGENIKNVIVDGKEFFSNDPKVATKNLPADAIRKLQVYDTKSDEANFSGINDGSRGKTINLVLKDDKKQAWFGNITAGIGTDERYQSSTKAFQFSKNTQLAMLGMFNNINQFGFSIKEYIDFNGGVENLMNSGGSISIDSDNSIPIDFGQTISGLNTAGAGGLNFTYEKKKSNQLNLSYLGNGLNRTLIKNTISQNYTNETSFEQHLNQKAIDRNTANRLNFGWKNQLDSSQKMLFNGNLSYNTENCNQSVFSESYKADTALNNLNNITKSGSTNISGIIHASYLKKLPHQWKIIKIGIDGIGTYNINDSKWENRSIILQNNISFSDNQFQSTKKNLTNYSINVSATRKILNNFYIQPELIAGNLTDVLYRNQGMLEPMEIMLDSLSQTLTKNYRWIRPAIHFYRSKNSSQFKISMLQEIGNMCNQLSSSARINKTIFYFTPCISWNYDYKNNQHLKFLYETQVNTPTSNQLLSTMNNNNPLQLFYGNRNLQPEYKHNLNLSMVIFDPFSFTSVFAMLQGTYTKNKINYARTITNNFNQAITLINVKDDYMVNGNVDFSAPIRAMGVNLKLKIQVSWNRGINLVNTISNINTNFTQNYSISLDNRKKDKLSVNIGCKIQISKARYSIQQSLNKQYLNASCFWEMAYTPSAHWSFSAVSDISMYYAQSFGNDIVVPIIKAKVTKYFLKDNRASISLDVFDILNKNKAVEQISTVNYLQQSQSNVIGRYVMLQFNYRLNKFSK